MSVSPELLPNGRSTLLCRNFGLRYLKAKYHEFYLFEGSGRNSRKAPPLGAAADGPNR